MKNFSEKLQDYLNKRWQSFHTSTDVKIGIISLYLIRVVQRVHLSDPVGFLSWLSDEIKSIEEFVPVPIPKGTLKTQIIMSGWKKDLIEILTEIQGWLDENK